MFHSFSLSPMPEDEPTGYIIDDEDRTEATSRNDAFEIIARTSLHTDLEDICDPVLSTYVVRMTAAGWAFALARSIHQPTDLLKTRYRGEGPVSVEHFAADYIAGFFAPARCWCEHDCCGHRHGYAEAKHIAGAVFAVAVHTSRNY